MSSSHNRFTPGFGKVRRNSFIPIPDERGEVILCENYTETSPLSSCRSRNEMLEDPIPTCLAVKQQYRADIFNNKRRQSTDLLNLLPSVEEEEEETNLNETAGEQMNYFQQLSTRFSGFSRNQWLQLVVLLYVNCSQNVNDEMLTTFLSNEIVKHGGSQFHISLIFGAYPLSNFIMCPLLTLMLNRVSCRRMAITGFATTTISTIALSQTGRITSTLSFVTICVILRILQALGSISVEVSSVFLASRGWKKELTFAFGAKEAFAGIGLAIGPLIGGYLYTIGGFPAPFYGMSLFSLLGWIVCSTVLEESPNETTASGNYLRLLRNPSIAVTALYMSVLFAGAELLNPQLQLYMSELHVSSITIGFMFTVYALSYSLFSAVIGVFQLSHVSERVTMICGGLVVALSYLLVGPSHIFIGIGWTRATVASVAWSMILLGFGSGLAHAPFYNNLYASAISYGLEDNETTDSLVGGLYTSITFFGELLSPMLGGIMMGILDDFKAFTSSFTALVTFGVVCCGTFYLFQARKEKSKTQRQYEMENIERQVKIVSITPSNQYYTAPPSTRDRVSIFRVDE